MTQLPIERPATWIPLLPRHLDRVNEIADEIHTSLPERPEVFEEKRRLFPDGCRVLVRDNRVVGYAVSHPWLLGLIPPLDEFLRALPETPTCLYLHDIVVLPAARGQRAAERFLDYLETLARRMAVGHLALVSVYGTDALWSRHRFEVTQRPELGEKLRSYGPTAKYMTRTLA
jgi:GNAT superfamily N-acetyltransferase